MTYQDKLHLDGRGSFRGVEFYVPSATGAIGRRTVIHEYPGRDTATSEDLGRRTRPFRFDAHVMAGLQGAEDYIVQRDKLIEALETPGPGQLVHPYRGTFRAVATGEIQMVESTAEGGMARFQLSFTEVPEEVTPVVTADTAAQVADAADAMAEVEATTFDESFSVVGTIEAVRTAITGTIERASSTLNSVQGDIAAKLQVIDDTAAAINDFADNAATLIQTPEALANQLTGLHNSIMGAVDTIGDAIDSTLEFFRADSVVAGLATLMAFGEDEPQAPETTPQRLIERANLAAFAQLQRVGALAESSRVIAVLPIESRDKAIEVRNTLATHFDTVLEDSIDDPEFQALEDLREAIIRHLDAEASELPVLSTYTPVATTPLLVVGQRLYGDPTREAEIVSRNNVRNPLMVSGGTELQVLSE